MNTLILAKLQAFARRRRRLIIMRGVFAAVAMLLATMMVVALIDWLFILPDWLRWTLSGLAYAAVLFAEWRACLRLLVHAPDPRELARLIEHAERQLREDLISAVELGQTENAFDSPQFRQLVQTNVAARLERVDMEALLPVRLLRRTMAIAGVIVIACVAAFILSGFQFGTLLARAMLPMANLGRVSAVKVKIVEPRPAETVTPQGDSVPLVIEIGGRKVNRVYLETFSLAGGREVVQMTAQDGQRFSGTINVGREDVQYRIRAGDALTRKYTLRAAARPHVVRFHKTYRYPEYTKLPEKTVMEEDGHLAAIEGTEVELRVETDQMVRVAELRVEEARNSYTMTLEPRGSQTYGVKAPMTKSAIYRVHLVAADTMFENKFSPEYEIRAEPDLVPMVELETPRQDLIEPANDVVKFTGQASDDLGVTKLERHFRINDGRWQTVPVAIAAGKECAIEDGWDLFPLGLKAGDSLTVKLVAFDLKGSRGESRPIQIGVTSSGFETRRLERLEALGRLFTAITEMRTVTDALEKKGHQTREQFDRLGEGDPQRRQEIENLATAFAEYERAHRDASALLLETLRTATPVHETGDLVLIARLFSRMDAGAALNALENVKAVSARPAAPYARDLLREAADACGRVAQRARLAEESCRTFVAAEQIDVLSESAQVISREIARVHALAGEGLDDPARRQMVSGRLRVLFAEMRGFAEMLRTGAEKMPGGYGDRFKRVAQKLGEHRIAPETLPGLAPGSKELKEFEKQMHVLARNGGDVHRIMLDTRKEFAGPPVRAYALMLEQAQPAYANLEKIRQECEAILRNERLPAELRSDLSRSRWDTKSMVISAYADAEEMRADADTYFVDDTRSLSLALEGLRGVATGPTGQPAWNDGMKKLATLDQSFRILEIGHNVWELHQGLMNLTSAERWEARAFRARTANPRDWEWLEARLQALPNAMGQLSLSDEALKKAVREAREILIDTQNGKFQATRAVNDEMNDRFKPDREMIAMAREVEAVAAQVKRALDLLRAPMEEARKKLGELSPKLSELMTQLAQEAQEAQQESAAAAAEAPTKQPEEAQAEARRQLEEQQELSRKIDALADAIRSEANKQDLQETQSRELARDADDALAMLREPPPRAEQALAEAAKAERQSQQTDALQAASKEQQKLADALKQLAGHFEAVEQGKPLEESRLALRQQEQALGIKEQLDAQYAQAAKFPPPTEQSPEGILQQLEKALSKNPLMQQELSAIAKNTLSDAGVKLASASAQENAVAQEVQKMAEQAQAEAQKAAEAALRAQAEAMKAAAMKAAAEAQRLQAEAMNAQAQAQNAPSTPQPNAQPPGDQAPMPAASQPPGQADAQSPENAQQSSPTMAQANAQPPSAAPQSTASPSEPSPATPPSAQPAPPNPMLTQAANRQMPIAEAAAQAGADIERAGRHEMRLANEQAGRQLQQLGQEVQETATNEVAAAQQALKSASAAEQAQASVDAAKAELSQELSQLSQAQGMPSAAQAMQNAQAAESSAPQQAAEGAMANAAQASQSPSAATQSTPGEQAAPAMAQSASPGPSPATAASQPSPVPSTPAPQDPASPLAALAQAGPATPQEQVWMARALDALDEALNVAPPQSAQQSSSQAAGQPAQQGQPSSQPGNQSAQAQAQSQAQAQAMAQAKQAMSAAAKAAAATMRMARTPSPSQQPGAEFAQGDEMRASLGGAQANADGKAHGALPIAQTKRTLEWGKLPKQVAEQLSQGQRESVSPEYRNQVETYYRVIAERAKKAGGQ